MRQRDYGRLVRPLIRVEPRRARWFAATFRGRSKALEAQFYAILTDQKLDVMLETLKRIKEEEEGRLSRRE